MPTVLAVNNYYYLRGGSETVFFEQNRALAGLGWRVIPFAMKHPDNLETEWSEYFVESNELGGAQSLVARLRHVPGVIYSQEARRKLARLLSASASTPDVCHAHNIYHHISPSILGMLKERGIPTVLTLHDLKLACPAYTMLTHDGICERCRGGRLHNVVVHRCIKQSTVLSAVVMVEAVLHRWLDSYGRSVDRYVVPSRFYIRKLVEWGLPEASLRHLPNCVDATRYRPQYSPGSGIVYFGRLSPEKGLTTLIRAAALASCHVNVVGTGPALESIRTLAESCGADVTFSGYLTGEKLHDAVRSARAVVLPSEWYENAPISVLEAYALGKPVIGARIGGIPELIRDRETGLLFSSGDVESLAEAFRSVVRAGDDEIEAMGRTARRWIEDSFSVAINRDGLLDIYREVGVTMRA